MDNARAIRGAFAVFCLVIDILLGITLYEKPGIHQGALRVFLSVNIPIVILWGIVAVWLQRPPTNRFLWASRVCGLLEQTALMVWVALTGSTSSYFLFLNPFGLLLYRVIFGYKYGLLMLIIVIVEHAIIALLEQFGAMPHAALWLASHDPSAGSVSVDVAAFVTFFWFDGLAFAFGGLISHHLAMARRALGNAESTLARMAQGHNLGRLSGVLLNDKYEMENLIGRGGMGEIYRARRLHDDLVCAIKVLHPYLVEPRMLERFRREAELAAGLPGQVAPAIYDASFSDTAESFIVMEHLFGEDLSSFLSRCAPLSTTAALDLLRQIALALDTAHGQGVVHRDLKPQNIFLEGRQGAHLRVRLLDFGISKLVDAGHSLTMTHGVLGTPGYMAPEQLFGHPNEVGPAADVFALGAIAYECLSGRKAFGDLSLQERMRTHHQPTPDSLASLQAGLPQGVDEVLSRAMAYTPALRFHRAIEFVEALDEVLFPISAAHGRTQSETKTS
jgi:tRNA A-37 threonylcarbamoyl transferase component Bud32